MSLPVSYNFQKHPEEDLDYGFNLQDWLTGGEQIDAVAFVATPSGLVALHDPANTGTTFAIWISGGAVGDKVQVTCKGTTDSTPPRVFVRTIYLNIVTR